MPATPPPVAASVVIPSLDSPWIGRSLAALAAEGAPGAGVEVIVVGRDPAGLVPRTESESGGAAPPNDASPGAARVPRVRFLETPEPLNPAAARNRGVAAALGEKLLFTDADCAPRRGWLARLSTALDASPVAGGSVTFPRRGNSWALADNLASFHELSPRRPAALATGGPLGSLNLACTRSAWERVGPFDEALTTSEDLDWVRRARAAGLPTAFVPEAVVEHAAVRRDRGELVAHARWYGEHLDAFRRRHPGVVGGGPTWRSRRRLALAAPVKSLAAALAIYAHRPELLATAAGWRAFPGVVLFKWAWYRAVLASWPAATREDPTVPPRPEPRR